MFLFLRIVFPKFNKKLYWLIAIIISSFYCGYEYFIPILFRNPTVDSNISPAFTKFYEEYPDSLFPQLSSAKQLYEHGKHQEELESFEQSFIAYKRSLDIFEKEGKSIGVIYCKLGLASINVYQGEFKEAEELIERCLKNFKKLNDFYGECECLFLMGIINGYRGRIRDARNFFKKGIMIAQHNRYKFLEIKILLGEGKCYRGIGNFAKALAFCEEAYELASQINNKSLQAESLKVLGQSNLKLLKFSVAQNQFNKAQSLLKNTDNKIREAKILRYIAELEIDVGRYNHAKISIQQSLSLLQKNSHIYNETVWRLCKAEEGINKIDEARICYERNFPEIISLNSQVEIVSFLIAYARFEQKRARYDEAKILYNRALEIAKKQKLLLDESIIYFHLATMDRKLSKSIAAREYYNQSLSIARQLNNQKMICKVLAGLGALEYYLDRCQEAETYTQNAITIAAQISDVNSMAYAMCLMGNIKQTQGFYSESKEYFNKSINLYDRTFNTFGKAKVFYGLGGVSLIQGNYEESLNYLDQALITLTPLEAPEYLTYVILEKGFVEYNRGNNEKAIKNFIKAHKLGIQIKNRWVQGKSLKGQAQIHIREGQPTLAEEKLGIAIRLFEEIEDKTNLSLCSRIYANLKYHFGDIDSAEKYLTKVLQITKEINYQYCQACVLNDLGEFNFKLGRTNQSIRYFEESAETAKKIGYRKRECLALVNQGKFWYHFGDFKKSAELLKTAKFIGQSLGDPIVNGKIHLATAGLHMMQGLFGQARTCAEQSLSLFKLGNHAKLMAQAIRCLGDIETLANNSEEAKHAYESCLTQANQINSLCEKAFALVNLAKLNVKDNEIKARQYLKNAEEIFKKIQNVFGESLCLTIHASIEERWGSYKQAQEYLKRKLYILQNLGYKTYQVITLTEIAGLYTKMGEYKLSEQTYQDALGMAKNKDSYYLHAKIYYGLGKLNFKNHETKRSLEYFKRAYELFGAAGDTLALIKTLKNISKIELRRNNFSSAKLSLKEALVHAQFRENKSEESKILGKLVLLSCECKDLTGVNNLLNDYKDSLPEGIPSSELKINTLLIKFHELQGNKELAKSYCQKAIRSAHEMKKKKKEAELYIELGNLEDDAYVSNKYAQIGKIMLKDLGVVLLEANKIEEKN